MILSPLAELRLRTLQMRNCKEVKNLSPLKGLRLETLGFTPKLVTEGIDVIRNMKSLRNIVPGYGVSLPAAEFWRRYDADEFSK